MPVRVRVWKVDLFTTNSLADTAWAFAVAAHWAPELYLLIERETVRRLEEFEDEELCRIAWGFAVCDLLREDFLRTLLQRISLSGKAPPPIHCAQLHQAALAVASKSQASMLISDLIPEDVRHAARDHWMDSVRSTDECGFQEEVYRELTDMGIVCAKEHRVGDGFLCVDLLVTLMDGRKVAMEVDGPTRFFQNDAQRVLGQTLLRNRLLEAHTKLPVVTVPYFEWEPLSHSNPVARQVYLSRKLEMVG